MAGAGIAHGAQRFRHGLQESSRGFGQKKHGREWFPKTLAEQGHALGFPRRKVWSPGLSSGDSEQGRARHPPHLTPPGERRSRIKKNRLPITLVTMPIGISCPLKATRATRSESTRRSAPPTTQAGIKIL